MSALTWPQLREGGAINIKLYTGRKSEERSLTIVYMLEVITRIKIHIEDQEEDFNKYNSVYNKNNNF